MAPGPATQSRTPRRGSAHRRHHALRLAHHFLPAEPRDAPPQQHELVGPGRSRRTAPRWEWNANPSTSTTSPTSGQASRPGRPPALGPGRAAAAGRGETGLGQQDPGQRLQDGLAPRVEEVRRGPRPRAGGTGRKAATELDTASGVSRRRRSTASPTATASARGSHRRQSRRVRVRVVTGSPRTTVTSETGRSMRCSQSPPLWASSIRLLVAHGSSVGPT